MPSVVGCSMFQEAREISRVKVTEKISYAEAIKKVRVPSQGAVGRIHKAVSGESSEPFSEVVRVGQCGSHY